MYNTFLFLIFLLFKVNETLLTVFLAKTFLNFLDEEICTWYFFIPLIFLREILTVAAFLFLMILLH